MTTLKQARDQGLNSYDEGKPCKIHGQTDRYVTSSQCVKCTLDAGAKRRLSTDKDLLRKQDRDRYYRNTSLRHWIKRSLKGIKNRAKQKNVPFDLTEDYLVSIWSDICPVFGIEMIYNCRRDIHINPDNQATLDRIRPELGYTKGNVVYISNQANRIKNDASSSQIKAVALWLETLENL